MLQFIHFDIIVIMAVCERAWTFLADKKERDCEGGINRKGKGHQGRAGKRTLISCCIRIE